MPVAAPTVTAHVPVPLEAIATSSVGKSGIRTEWIHVSPELAKEFLTRNVQNRRIDWDEINGRARDMAGANWLTTHQGIAFNDRGELIDGQQRLHALIVAGVTVLMMVTFGLPSKVEGKELTTMDCVDRGRTRSIADQLKIQHGIKKGGMIASITSSIARLCWDQRTKRLSVANTLEIYRAFEHPMTFVIMHRSNLPGLRQAGLLAAFAFAGATEEGFFGGATPIATMYQNLLEGSGLRKDSPMEKLREFVTSDAAKLFTRGTDRGLSELVLQAIMLELKGEKIEKLELRQDGADHFRNLQPKRVAKVAKIFKLPENAPRKAAA